MNTKRVIVPVATVWSTNHSNRDVDKAAIDGDVKQWVQDMSDEQSVDLSDNSRVVTQALFNDEVIVDDIVGDWAKVFVPSQRDDSDGRGYPGWIPVKLLSDKDTNYSNTTATVRIATKFATLYDADKKPVMELSLGTVLNQIATEGDWIKVITPLGENYIKADAIKIPFDEQNAGQVMVDMAKQYMGMRYLWAGISSDGFDCSGLVYTMHRVLGFDIPRDADDQQASGMPVAPEDIQPGDLVFFAYDHGEGYVHHVGMYIGNGKMIESRTPGKQVDIADLTELKFASEFAGFRRYWR
ncbi:C40 family peptidase [Lentilactobacillus sp. Marseille-Q4993]|uniref:C40 family peptidase n=1 Tax=Lentilactobacillus sp. Marseille-Q4993 TaxID=3039492 RepID=UPI0024BC5FDB|nr:C40 family peptidase [Lentilactobacillus sp. Marseille-Q4993]